MNATHWLEIKSFTGMTHDATVEQSHNGCGRAWRVTTRHIETGETKVRRFASAEARRFAMEWAALVTIPPITSAHL